MLISVASRRARARAAAASTRVRTAARVCALTRRLVAPAAPSRVATVAAVAAGAGARPPADRLLDAPGAPLAWPASISANAREAAIARHAGLVRAVGVARPWWLTVDPATGAAIDIRNVHVKWPATREVAATLGVHASAAAPFTSTSTTEPLRNLRAKIFPANPLVPGGGTPQAPLSTSSLSRPVDEGAASRAWLAWACSPLPLYGQVDGVSASAAAEVGGVGARLAFNGSLAAAARALGVVDPWSPAAADVDAANARAVTKSTADDDDAAGGGDNLPTRRTGDLVDWDAELASAPPLDLFAAATASILGAGAAGIIATPALAPPAESIARRAATATAALLRRLESVDGSVAGADSPASAGKTDESGSPAGRLPATELASLTLRVAARRLQRHWRAYQARAAARAAAAEKAARRAAGRSDAVRAAVAALVDALGNDDGGAGGDERGARGLAAALLAAPPARPHPAQAPLPPTTASRTVIKTKSFLRYTPARGAQQLYLTHDAVSGAVSAAGKRAASGVTASLAHDASWEAELPSISIDTDLPGAAARYK